jgi:hypothetical protein
VFAESCVFSKQSQPPFLCNPPSLSSYKLHNKGHTFSRSYGVNLPSSLTSVLSRALGYSPRPPESVCGTDNEEAPRAAFLGSMGSLSYEAEASPHHLSALSSRLSLSGPTNSAYWLEPGFPITRLSIPFSVPARFNATLVGAGILTCLPSPTLFSLGLGSD